MRLKSFGSKSTSHPDSAFFSLPSFESRWESTNATWWTQQNSQSSTLRSAAKAGILVFAVAPRDTDGKKKTVSLYYAERKKALEGFEIGKGRSQHLESRCDSAGDNKDEMEQIFKRRLKRESRVRSKLVCPTSLTFFRSVSGLNRSTPLPFPLLGRVCLQLNWDGKKTRRNVHI